MISYSQQEMLARLKHEEMQATAARERLYRQLQREATGNMPTLAQGIGKWVHSWIPSRPSIAVDRTTRVSRPQVG